MWNIECMSLTRKHCSMINILWWDKTFSGTSVAQCPDVAMVLNDCYHIVGPINDATMLYDL